MEPVNPWRRAFPGRVAHRGGAREAPENTLFAFHNGLGSGADALELDVQGTADGVAVVLHDEDLGRVGGVPRRVDTMTLDDLRTIDPCAAHAGYAGIAAGDRPPPKGFRKEHFRVPTLEEVLATFPGVPLLVELKTTAPADEVARLLALWDRRVDALVGSFDDDLTATVKANAPHVATAPGTAGVHRYLEGGRLEHDALVVPERIDGKGVVDEKLVARAHAEGMAVLVWTVDDEDAACRLLGVGVDMLITDRPAGLAPLFAGRAGTDAASAFEREEE